MNIDYNRLTVASLRELLRLHPPRLVIRHFEARGYSHADILQRLYPRKKTPQNPLAVHDPGEFFDSPVEDVPW